MKLGEYGKLAEGKKCRFCNSMLPHQCVEYYDHDGGWKVDGFSQKQWLYLTCPGCGHQWSFAKLGIERGDK